MISDELAYVTGPIGLLGSKPSADMMENMMKSILEGPKARQLAPSAQWGVVCAKATDDELKQITDYLAEQFKGEVAKPINLNSASAVDLESVAGLLRKEAATWIAYRTKNGPCKTLDDLKKVVGVPFKKIDERRDSLVCVILGAQPQDLNH